MFLILVYNKFFIFICSVTSTHVTSSSQLQQLQQLVTCQLHYLQLLHPPLVDKENGTKFKNDSLKSIQGRVITIVSSCNSTLDLRLVCGHLLAVLSAFMFVDGPIALFELINTQDSDSLNYCGELHLLPKLARVAVYHGILCCVPAENLFQLKVSKPTHSDHDILGMVILDQTIDLGNSPDDGELVLSCARLLNHWTLRVLSQPGVSAVVTVLMPVNGETERKFLGHLWISWEHYLDRVKHATFDTFMNFLDIIQKALPDKSGTYFMAMFDRQIPLVSSKKSSINAIRCLLKFVSAQDTLNKYPDLPCHMMKSLSDFSRAGICAEVLTVLFTNHANEVDPVQWQEYWIPTIFSQFKTEMMTFGFEILIKHLLIANQSCISYAINYILSQSESMSYDWFLLLMTCVKVTRNTKEIKFNLPQGLTAGSLMWKQIIPYYSIQSCIYHVDERVQISAFGLLCESKKTTELFEQNELKLILDFFQGGLCVDVPAQRQILCSFAKKMFLRINDGVNTLNKNALDLKKKSTTSAALDLINETLLNYSYFCKNLFQILLVNLHASSSHPRRASSLTLLQTFQEILCSNDQLVHSLDLATMFCNKVTVHTLIEALDDDYETNKIIVLKILNNLKNIHDLVSGSNVDLIFICIFKMASSCKPPETLTATYLLKFVQHHPAVLDKFKSDNETCNCSRSLILCQYIHSKLREEIDVAVRDLLSAACTAPMYGALACMRAVLEDDQIEIYSHECDCWKDFINKLLGTCFQVRDIVRPIVENDSPEGNVPMDFEILQTVVEKSIANRSFEITNLLPEDSSNDMVVKARSVSAQMLLICSWRCIKEVALILGNLVEMSPLPPSSNMAMDRKNITKIGEYFLSVLVETKHRGAFEQSFAGFAKVCATLWSCKDPFLNKLPSTWIENILKKIQAEDEDRFCATRRSAGVPFIVQAILASEPHGQSNPCLKNTMTTLLEYVIHLKQNHAVRLHSFNILRAVYRDTKLGDHIMPYVAPGVMIAIEGFTSTLWSIRNSATLLFAALLTRMLGVKRNKDDLHSNNTMSGLVFFKRFPDLYKFMLDKLEGGANEIEKGMIGASIYPVLLLLGRLSPAPLEGVTSSLSLGNFVPHVIRCSTSQIFQLRDLASRALGPLITVNNLYSTFSQLCDQARSQKQNSIHGALLSIYKVLETFATHLDDEKQRLGIVSNIISLVPLTSKENPCFLTRSIAIKIFRFTMQKKWLSGDSTILDVIDESRLIHNSIKSVTLLQAPGVHLLEIELAKFIFERCSWVDVKIQTEVLTSILSSVFPEVRCLAYEKCLNMFTFSRSLKMSQWLKYVMKEDDVRCRALGYRLIVKILFTLNSQYPNFRKKIGRDYSLEQLLESLRSRLEEVEDWDASPVQEDELISLIPLVIELIQVVNRQAS